MEEENAPACAQAPPRGQGQHSACLGSGQASEDSLLLELLPGPWPGTPVAHQADGHPGSSLTPQSLQPIPASSGWASEDSGLSGGSWSVPVARGLPGRASSRVSASCSGVDGSLRVARGPPSGLQTLLSESAKEPQLSAEPVPSDMLSSAPSAGPARAWRPAPLPHPGVPLRTSSRGSTSPRWPWASARPPTPATARP